MKHDPKELKAEKLRLLAKLDPFFTDVEEVSREISNIDIDLDKLDSKCRDSQGWDIYPDCNLTKEEYELTDWLNSELSKIINHDNFAKLGEILYSYNKGVKKD